MKWLRPTLIAVLLAGFLVVPACVEITGQRITWFYDQPEDTLYLLIHYDGIHEVDRDRKGVEQIPQFVDNGDVMLLDWPFHLDRKRIREAAQQAEDPLHVEGGRIAAALDVRALGHYREPNGRIGAAQLVTIRRASDVLQQVNDLISRAIEASADETELPRTVRRIREAAAERHQWITLDGHMIRISVPVHAAEWAHAKGALLVDLFDAVIENDRDPDDDGESPLRTLVEGFASAPISYIDEGHRVSLLLGRRDRPTTLRLQIREAYEDSLEDDVIKAVPLDLDEELARSLLDPDVELAPELAHLRSWGPPEDQVRALINAARGQPASRRRVIAEHLARWGARWNREQAVPSARLEVDPDEFAASWATWYERVKHPPSHR